MKLIIDKEINAPKLMDELLKAGLIQPTTEDGTSSLQGNTLYILDTADTDAIQIIINNHTIDPLPQIPTADERLAAIEEALLMII
jgi:hypothetical protein